MLTCTRITGTGSGEYLDRADTAQILEELETGRYDLVLAEDLGRIFRRFHAFLFCETAEDLNTRVIAPNDHLDTEREDWRLCASLATLRHEMYNSDTAKRIRRSLRNRFRLGGIVQCEIYGYVKPHAKAKDDDVSKDPTAEAVYDEWFKKLESGASFSEVADWLNEQGVPLGPYSRTAKWDCRKVSRYTYNPILKGLRVRNDRISKRVNKTGRRKSVKAPPEERLERVCPHLAFIEPRRYDRVIRMLQERNAKYRRTDSNGRDSRKDIPKKRTRYPGQSVHCGVCGRIYVFGGHGQTDRLMCSGAREYKCWNAITFDGPDACRRLSSTLIERIEKLPAFEPEFLAMLREEVDQLTTRRTHRLRELADDERRLERETCNIMAAIRQYGDSTSLLAELKRLEDSQADLLDEKTELERDPQWQIEIPSIERVKQVAREEFSQLAVESQEFARLMRRLIPSIYVFPFRLCDGGHIVLRASMTFTALPFVPADARSLTQLSDRLSQDLKVDLFDPPQRERYREQVIELVSINDGKLTERDIARQLGITQPAVQNARQLDREMQRLGLADAYIPVPSPPADYEKLRRHDHKRYRFEPLERFPRQWPV